MSDRRFGDTDIQAVLDGKDVVVLATLTPSGSPLAMPMWFVHDEHSLVMVSAPGLAKIRNLQRDPRVSVVAEGGDRAAPHGLVLTGSVIFFDGQNRYFSQQLVPANDRFKGLAKRFVAMQEGKGATNPVPAIKAA